MFKRYKLHEIFKTALLFVMEVEMKAGSPIRLAAEFELYEARKSEWLQKHRDEFVVVKRTEILGFFSNFHEAYSAGVQKYGINTDFLVKRVVPQEPLFEVF